MKKVLIVVPVYNEESILKKNITYLNCYLHQNFKYNYEILITDNKSNDKTKEIGKDLEKNLKFVKYFYINKKGKGLAIKQAFNKFYKDYDILSFMDSDLSTDITYFNKLIENIIINDYDITIGSRHKKESIVKRSLLRNIISYGYIFLQKILFSISFSDTQCGFKAIKSNKYKIIKDKIKDNAWFFDTEFLVISEIYGFKIKEIPVKWKEDRDSKIKVFKDSFKFLKKLIQLRFRIKKIKNEANR